MTIAHRLLLLPLALAAGCTLLNDPADIAPGADETYPGQPQGLVASPGNGRMELRWSSVTDWDFDHYVVYAAETGQSLGKVGETGASSYTVQPLSNDVVYDFMVLAVDRFGNVSAPSDTVTAQPDGVAPTVAATYNPGPQSPANKMTDVIFSFSEAMDRSSVESSTTVTASLGALPECVWSWYSGDTEAKCDLVVGGDPAQKLGDSTTYHVIIGTPATDVAGNPLSGTPVDAWFTTAAADDLTPPGLSSITVGNYQSAAQPVVDGVTTLGVFPETSVVFTFNEPMDTVATAAAVSVTGGPGYNGGTKTWNATGTVLTFDPDVSYLPGTLVTLAIAPGAQDASGNDLPAFTSRTFRVAYRATIDLYSESGRDGWGYSTGGTTSVHAGAYDVWPSTAMLVGDSSGNGQYKGFLSFLRTGLDPELTRFTGATLTVYQYSVTGAPYDGLDRLDFCFPAFPPLPPRCYYTELVAAHVNLESPGAGLDAGDFTSATLTGSYEIATAATLGTWSADVLTAVEDDRLDGRSRSQWRLEFPYATDGDGAGDYANFYTGEIGANVLKPTLTLTYEYYQ